MKINEVLKKILGGSPIKILFELFVFVHFMLHQRTLFMNDFFISFSHFPEYNYWHVNCTLD